MTSLALVASRMCPIMSLFNMAPQILQIAKYNKTKQADFLLCMMVYTHFKIHNGLNGDMQC